MKRRGITRVSETVPALNQPPAPNDVFACCLVAIRLLARNDPVMIVDRGGGVIFATERAWELKREFSSATGGDALPGELLQWLGRNPTPGETFEQTQSGNRLTWRCGPATEWPCSLALGINGNGNCCEASVRLLKLEEERDLPDLVALRKLGLTEREAEVLHWITQGKRNVEIAVILGVRVGTVKKHCENIFMKLNVENRSSAAAIAMQGL